MVYRHKKLVSGIIEKPIITSLLYNFGNELSPKGHNLNTAYMVLVI